MYLISFENMFKLFLYLARFDWKGVVDTDMQLQVRTSDVKLFPRVEKFVGLHSGGKLVKAEDSAIPVVDFALCGPGEAYTEGRYGT